MNQKRPEHWKVPTSRKEREKWGTHTVCDCGEVGHPPGSELTTRIKKNEFCDIPIVKADATTIRPTIFSDLEPNNIGLVFETPRFHRLKTPRQSTNQNYFDVISFADHFVMMESPR